MEYFFFIGLVSFLIILFLFNDNKGRINTSINSIIKKWLKRGKLRGVIEYWESKKRHLRAEAVIKKIEVLIKDLKASRVEGAIKFFEEHIKNFGAGRVEGAIKNFEVLIKDLKAGKVEEAIKYLRGDQIFIKSGGEGSISYYEKILIKVLE